MPVRQDSPPIPEMVDRVVAEHSVERCIGERQLDIGVGNAKGHAICESVVPCATLRRRNSGFVDVDADDLDARPLHESLGDPAGPTRDLQSPLITRKPQPSREVIALVRGDPTRLTQIFAERLLAHGAVHRSIVFRVMAVVEVDGFGHDKLHFELLRGSRRSSI